MGMFVIVSGPAKALTEIPQITTRLTVKGYEGRGAACSPPCAYQFVAESGTEGLFRTAIEICVVKPALKIPAQKSWNPDHGR